MKSFATAAALLVVLGGCVSAKSPEEGPPSPIEVLPAEVLTTPIAPDEKIIAQELRAIEAAFARRSCAQVQEHEQRLAPLRKNKLTLPLSTLTALAYCESQSDPTDKNKQEAALELLVEAQKNLGPLFNTIVLEDLKSERHLALGDKASALQSKKRMKELIAALDASLVKIDAEILTLSDGVAQLSAPQKEKYDAALKAMLSADTLFSALTQIDALLVEVVNEKAREVLLSARQAVLARIESDFATDATVVEMRMREGREDQARSYASQMKERFPRENYTRRIDALLGLPGAPVAQVSPIAPGNAAAPANSLPENTALSPEAAFDAARKQLDAGRAEEAVKTLDALPEGVQTDRTRRLRREAMEADVRAVRVQVRTLFARSKATTDSASQLNYLQESKKLLENLLTRYPDAPGRTGIERNLRSINLEIKEKSSKK